MSALDALEPAERQGLDEHVTTCPGCREEAQAMREALALLPQALDPVAPSPGTLTGLRQRIERSARPTVAQTGVGVLPFDRARSRGLVAATVAVGLLAATFAGLWLRERRHVAEVQDLLDRREAYYQAELAKQEKKYAILRSPNLRTVDMRGEAGGAHLDVRAFIDKERRTWLLLSYQLPRLSADKDYELWFFNGAKPVRAGILSQDPGEPTRIDVPPDLPEITATAVTIEPKGGLPAPSGPVVMKSDL